MQATRPDGRTLLGFGAVVVSLGANFVAVRFSNQELPPMWGAYVRFGVASLALLGMALAQGRAWPRGPALAGAFLYGALAFGLNYGLLYWALQWLPAATAAVVFATIPLTTYAMAVAIGLERLRGLAVAGSLLVVGGVVVLSAANLSAAAPAGAFAALVGASLCAAASGVVVKKAPKVHPVVMNAIGMATGAAILYAVSLYRGELHVIPTRLATDAALGWLVASSAAAFVIMVWVIGRWTASAAAYTAVLAPLVTIPLANLLRGETVGLTFVAGAGIVLLGVYIGALVHPRRPTEAPPSSPGTPSDSPRH